MLRWVDWQWCWIKEGIYFDNKTINDWIALKFNPGDSTALYSSADKGISILNVGHQHWPTSKTCIGRRRYGKLPKATPPTLK